MEFEPMQNPRFAAVHRFHRDHLVYPLALSTLLCAILISARVAVSSSRNYGFLVWNLFLAWLPYLFSVWIEVLRRRRPGRRAGVIVLGVLWVLFLPNAPYIMTDFGHLLHYRPFPLMYDVVLIFAFAWTGLLLGLVSLHLLEVAGRRAWGGVAGGAFVVGSAMLTGAGIYLGRFLRWNSWDVIHRPGELLAAVAEAVLHPLGHTSAIAHSLTFTTVVLLCHLTFVALRQSDRTE
jgi:uncharacterized membrane protein